jgi:hypothetical protein
MRQGMRQGKLVIGCDVSASFIILHDGKNALRIEDPKDLPEFPPNTVFVLEQTGAYGIRWAQVFSNLGEVYIADGRDFKNFRLAHTRQKNDNLDAFYLREYFLTTPSQMPTLQPSSGLYPCPHPPAHPQPKRHHHAHQPPTPIPADDRPIQSQTHTLQTPPLH